MESSDEDDNGAKLTAPDGNWNRALPSLPVISARVPARTDVAVIGGGVIGLSIAWALGEAGIETTVFERDTPGRGTSWAAAGMLAPAAEIGFEEVRLYRLGRRSLAAWPAFAARLEALTGQTIDYRTEGTLIVADDPDSAEALRRMHAFQQRHGAPVDWLSGAEALEREPFLRPRLAGAVFSPEDHQVDNRRLVEALRAAVELVGGRLVEKTGVSRVHPDARRPLVELDGGLRVEARVVILAAGVWSGSVGGLAPYRPPIRPVKGQIVQVHATPTFALRHVVRGPRAYLAPKSDGRIVIGATSEEMGFDTTVTAGGLRTVLEGAWDVVPGIDDLPVSETWAGLRPASRDHAPLLGPTGRPGVLIATGHYRHGLLLAPVTAEALTHLVESGETPEFIRPFSPRRFDAV